MSDQVGNPFTETVEKSNDTFRGFESFPLEDVPNPFPDDPFASGFENTIGDDEPFIFPSKKRSILRVYPHVEGTNDVEIKYLKLKQRHRLLNERHLLLINSFERLSEKLEQLQTRFEKRLDDLERQISHPPIGSMVKVNDIEKQLDATLVISDENQIPPE